MARGYPDFFGPSSFCSLALYTQLRPATVVVPAGFTVGEYNITGRYILTGGPLLIIDDDSLGLSNFNLWIDGVVIELGTFREMYQWQMVSGDQFPIYLTDYSPADHRFGFAIKGGYSFALSWLLTYTSSSTIASTVQGRLWRQDIL